VAIYLILADRFLNSAEAFLSPTHSVKRSGVCSQTANHWRISGLFSPPRRREVRQLRKLDRVLLGGPGRFDAKRMPLYRQTVEFPVQLVDPRIDFSASARSSFFQETAKAFSYFRRVVIT